MRILIITDIHSNIFALDAVLKDVGEFDAVWCLGDIVGYGPDPNDCIERVRSLPNLTCLLGNHDAAVVNKINLDTFNTEAKNSVLWMQSILSHENLTFLKGLTETAVIGEVTLAHGSPRNPIWEYILDTVVARINLGYFDTQLCFVGHTHLPVYFYVEKNSIHIRWKIMTDKEKIYPSGRAIINPGSVGQPRDRDSRASYAIYDSDQNIWELRRVAYDITQVQERIYSIGLPARNAIRLSEGY